MTDQYEPEEQAPEEQPSVSKIHVSTPYIGKYKRPTDEFKQSLPSNQRWFSNDEIRQGLHKQLGYTLMGEEWSNAMVRQFQAPNQAYFTQDPKRLAKYYNFLRSAPQGWEPPGWMDPQKIVTAYNFMSEYTGKDWMHWKPLDEDDPANIYLTALSEPPPEYQMSYEKNPVQQKMEDAFGITPNTISQKDYTPQQMTTLADIFKNVEQGENGEVMLPENLPEDEYALLMDYLYAEEQEVEPSPFMDQGAWQDLETWQQAALMILSPQPMQGRPDVTRAVPAVIQGLQASVGAMAAASLISGAAGMAVGGLIGAGAGTAAAPGIGTAAGGALGAVAGATTFALATYQAYTGKEIPVVNKMLEILDLPATVSERLIGMAIQAGDDEQQEVMENLRHSFQAGQFTYETLGIGTNFLNLMSRGFQAAETAVNSVGLDVEWSTGTQADFSTGEIWALEKAVAEPMLIRGGLIGGAALDEARAMLIRGDSIESVYVDFVDRYGYSGTLGDFLAQSVLDPMQFAPYAADTIGMKVADAYGKPALAEAFRSVRGNILIDAMPIGFQQLAQSLANIGKKPGDVMITGSRGPFDAIKIYQNQLQTGRIPYNVWPVGDEQVPVTWKEAPPDVFSDAADFYSDAIARNAAAADADGKKVINYADWTQEVRGYIDQHLKDAGMDLDLKTDEGRAAYNEFLTNTAQEMQNVQMDVLLNSDRSQYKSNLQDAFQRYFDDKFAPLPVGERTVQARYMPELDSFDRWLGGITEDGERLSALEVVDLPEGSPGWKKQWAFLTNLKKESKGAFFMDNLFTNMYALSELSQNPSDLVKMGGQVAGVDAVILNQVGQSLIDSPSMGSMKPGVSEWYKTGIPGELLTIYTETGDARGKLLGWSEVAGLKPGELLNLVKTDPASAFQAIINGAEARGDELGQNAARAVAGMDPAGLKNEFAVYLGKDPAPWNYDQFRGQYFDSMGEFMENFMVERYNIKPENWMYRLSRAMKTWQSLMVLGYNPLYAAYNYVNNVVTRTAQGVGGFLPKKARDTWWSAFGHPPARTDVGIGISGTAEGGQRGYTAFSAAMDTNDIISAFHAAGSKASKLGLFSRISSMIEASESAQAVTIGTMEMWSKTWKEDVGFRKMDAQFEADLRNKGISPDIIYSLIRDGKNMDQIDSKIYKEGGSYRGISAVADDAIRNIAPNNPEITQQMLDKLGVTEELRRLLEPAKTPLDAQIAYDTFMRKMNENIDRAVADDWIERVRSEDIENRVRAEGIAAVPDIIGEMTEAYFRRIDRNMIDNEAAALLANAQRAMGRHEQADKVWSKRLADQKQDWSKTNSHMLHSMVGILDAVGVDSPDVHPIVINMSNMMNGWGEFFAERQLIMADYFDADRVHMSADARTALWKQTQRRISQKYEQHIKSERIYYERMHRSMGELYQNQSGRPASEIVDWGNDVLAIQDRIRAEVLEFRQSLIETDLSREQKEAAFSTFNDEVLRPLYAERRHITIDEAQRLVTGEILNVDDMTPEQMLRQKALPSGEEGQPAPETPTQPQPEPTVSRVTPVDPNTLEHNPVPPLDPNKVDPADVRQRAEDIRQQYEADIAERKTRQYARIDRDQFREKITRSFSLSAEETTGVMALLDAHAEVWAIDSDKSPDQWYSDRVADVQKDQLYTQELVDDWIKGKKPDTLAAAEVSFLDDGRAIIKAFNNERADVTALMHEIAHVFYKELGDTDIKTITDWAGIDDPNSVELQEKFARGFERYLFEDMAADVAPPKMLNVFQKFAAWLKGVYRNLIGSDIDVDVSQDMKRLYDRLFFDQNMIDRKQATADRFQYFPKGDTTTAMGVDLPDQFEMQFRIVNLPDLITSHKIDGTFNPDFAQELQGRFRERLSSRTVIVDRAQNLRPDALLMDTRQTDTGPMVILADGTVISGNGRTLYLMEALRNYPESFAKYQAELQNYLGTYGFSEGDLEGIEYPVIVRQLTDDVDLIKFADDANKDRLEAMSTPEIAYSDVKRWDPKRLAELEVAHTQYIDDIIRSNKNEEIMASYLADIGTGEKNAMIAGDGGYSKEGLARIKASLLANVFGDTDAGKMIVSLFFESTDPIFNNYKTAIERSLGELVKLKSKVEVGQITPTMSLSKDVADVIAASISIKNQYGTFDNFLKEGPGQLALMGGDAYSELGLYNLDATAEVKRYKQDLLHFFAENMRKVTPQSEFIKRYVERVLANPGYTPGQIELIPGERMSKDQLAAGIFQDLVNEEASNPFRNYKPNLQDGLLYTTTARQQTIEIKSNLKPAGRALPGDKIEISSDFLSDLGSDPGIREDVIAHELAHNLIEDTILKNSSEWDQANDALLLNTIETDRDVRFEYIFGMNKIGEAIVETVKNYVMGEEDPMLRWDQHSPDRKPPWTHDQWQAAMDWAQHALDLSGVTKGDFLAEVQRLIKEIDKKYPPTDKLLYTYQQDIFSKAPVATTETPMYEGQMLDEVYSENLRPLVEEMRRITMDDFENRRTFSIGDLDEEQQIQMKNYLKMVNEDMAGTKLISMRHGEMMRDRALLNYSQRYGIDSVLDVFFPYQFWFTRSMGEWAKRMIDRPSWFSMYARYRLAQQKMEQEGIPSRFGGTTRIPAPWMPDWMGDGLHVDPMGQLFPFAQWGQPMEFLSRTAGDVNYRTQRIIQQWVQSGQTGVSAKQAAQAIEQMDGPLWRKAYVQAQQEMSQKELDPMNITSFTMSPAMWWTMPYQILKGTPEQIQPLPGTRMGQALRSWSDGPLGAIGNLMAMPEETLRRKFNLNAYGEWGDYYTDRTLANMATEPQFGAQAVLQAMIEREGPVFEEAIRRVEAEISLRVPGSETALAIKEGRLGAIPFTLLHTLLPSKILPEGEIVQRGLKTEYNKAWSDYENGDLDAVNRFFDENPEYKARIALFDEPEERLKDFLVDEIWENYMALENLNKGLAVDQLGGGFEQMFLDKQTRDYTAIDLQTLAYWAKRLGGMVPKTEETSAVTDMPAYMREELKLYRPEVVQEVEKFWEARESKYPNYKEMQDAYYSLPEDPKDIRKDYLEENPALKKYWDWKDDYYDTHPLVDMYVEEVAKKYDSNEAIFTTSNEPLDTAEYNPLNQLAGQYAQNMDSALSMQMAFMYYSGAEISGGARALLLADYEKLGKPGDSFEEWVKAIIDRLME